ncbi:two-component system chemotaxis response regulator CheV [Mobilisporobacter senegalensis]|uniref:Stage 0 sporulation protein A homolog n=1 Tax=Mobilisporobacter senegalensis TaxID=1329262 RepID=A0A3N1XS40_9FIRM|nr:chemotaxis protein [Mobilisporobacter senegalensis]ROR29469.1 two-component system chemotaxis response regulator CheV [Mobilisporobacter senegalensis]
MDKGILLESGTNELEILEFQVGNNYYGINVAKINEILPYQKPTPVPNAHPSIEGIFMPRDTVISIIDLAKSLNLPDSTDKTTDKYIVTNFNKLNTGFHVHGVVGIHRVSWEEILKPDSTISSEGSGLATGIIKLDGKLIIILDFEKIVSDINPETGLKVSDIDQLGKRKRNESPILIAEDSHLLSKLILECLHKAGYTNVVTTNNGQEAWNKLNEYKASGTIETNVSCVITDIEMPQMDGHRLTKLVKSDDAFKGIPVVIFSSLINDDMRRKGELLGADAQLTKPEIGELVKEIDKLVLY